MSWEAGLPPEGPEGLTGNLSLFFLKKSLHQTPKVLRCGSSQFSGGTLFPTSGFVSHSALVEGSWGTG